MTTSERDFEQLSLLLDGELDTAACRDLKERIALEPELAATWGSLQQLNVRLQEAYGGVDAAGVPNEIEALLGSEAPAAPAKAKVYALFPRRLAVPVALAASVVLAVSLALFTDVNGDTREQRGSSLAAALESLPSGDDWHALRSGGQIQTVLTFPARDGSWCREFLLREPEQKDAQRGVACRRAEGWHTEVLAQVQESGRNDVYRPAGASDNSAVQHFIREQAADIPLDGKKEASLIAQGWRQ